VLTGSPPELGPIEEANLLILSSVMFNFVVLNKEWWRSPQT